MKYIFLTGAPGSKWSLISRSFYFSPDIDQTDLLDHRNHVNEKVIHTGSYFDPGMEFGHGFDKLSSFTKQECEDEFDRPFSGNGYRIIKSHVFAYHLDFLRETWPDCPIMIVERSDADCIEHWFNTGGFDIQYPDYRSYYQNKEKMIEEIIKQNQCLREWAQKYPGTAVSTRDRACEVLGVKLPPSQTDMVYLNDYSNLAVDYGKSSIQVTIHKV